MGGAAGHMAHPFDLPEVNTGNDLIDFFIRAAEHLQDSPGSVKIDGVNVSFKLVDSPSGKEFAVDRGSTKPIDIEGITAGRIGERFPEGHGMLGAVSTLLNIFNTALPEIQQELQALGMWDDPTIFLNTEYVMGTTNVTQYDKNFLAVHGVNQFYEKTNTRTQAYRPGAQRPEGLKAPSTEVSYDENTLNTLVEKVSPYAEKYGFEVYGSVPTENVEPIDFEATLDTPFSVEMTPEDTETVSLREWLDGATNPRGNRVATKEGKNIGALSKEVYMSVLNGVPMVEFLATQEDVLQAINGAIFYHATRVLGNDILNSLTSPMGDVKDHEGVVLRGLAPYPVKITGEFILGGMQTGFREHKELNEQMEQKQHLALIPGGFKPPHKGHLEMIKFYHDRVGPNGKVIVLMGSGGKEPRTINGKPITLEDSMSMWEAYLKNDPDIPWPSDQVEFQNVESGGPIAPIIDYIREQANPETEVIHLGAGQKDADRWEMMINSPKNNPRGVEVHIVPAPNMIDAQGNPLSASAMRKSVEERDLETFKNFIPDTSLHVAEELFIKLSGALLMENKEANPLPLGIFLRLVREALHEQRYISIPQIGAFVGSRGYSHTPARSDQTVHDPSRPLETIKKPLPVWDVKLPGGKTKRMNSENFGRWFHSVGGKLPPNTVVKRQFRSGDPADFRGRAIGPGTGLYYQDVTDQFKMDPGEEDVDFDVSRQPDKVIERIPMPGDEKAGTTIAATPVGSPGAAATPRAPTGVKNPMDPTEAEEAAEMSMPWEHPQGSGMKPTQSKFVNEASTQRSSFGAVSHQANLDSIGPGGKENEQSAEASHEDNDDHEGRLKSANALEETSSVAAGDAGGFSGGAFEDLNIEEENKAEAERTRLKEEEKKEELVEKVMNYLLNKGGIQYAD